MRKPRSDARLKTLSPDVQQEIYDYGRDHSLMETKTWLAGRELVTSVAALSEFLSWWASPNTRRLPPLNPRPYSIGKGMVEFQGTMQVFSG